jgi:hypothetical protein
MVNCRINPDRKLSTLHLWDHGWDIDDICFALMNSHQSLYHWHQIFAEHDNVIKPVSQLLGPKHIISHAVLTTIYTIYTKDSDLYLDELCTLLAVEYEIIVF